MPASGASHELWTDRGVLHERVEKSACALAAVAQVLAERRPLGGGESEFLALYERARAASPEAFTDAWSDPTAYWWVRLAYRLAAAVLRGAPLDGPARAYTAAIGAPDPRDALALHLERWKPFALGTALQAGLDLPLATPLSAAPPLSIPGTRLVLSGPSRVAVAGVRGGLLVDPRGAPLETTTCAAVPIEGSHLRLDAAAFHLPAFSYRLAPEMLDAAFQARHASLTERSLDLVRRFAPETHAQMARALRVVAWKPREAADYTNVSHSELPGAFICGAVDEPHEMADVFVHEFHHGRLFALEERGPLLDAGAEGAAREEHYSPWRRDRRGYNGILHAVYVHVAALRFWTALAREGVLPAEARAYALDRLLRYPLQLALGAHVLRGARFTERGASLMTALEEDARAASRDAALVAGVADAPALRCREDGTFVREASESDGRPLTVRASVLEHLRRGDVAGECAGRAGALGLVS